MRSRTAPARPAYHPPVPPAWAEEIAEDDAELAVLVFLADALEVDDDLPVRRIHDPLGYRSEPQFHGDPAMRAPVTIPHDRNDPDGPRLFRPVLAEALDRLVWRGLLIRVSGTRRTVRVDWIAVAAAAGAARKAERRRRAREYRRTPEYLAECHAEDLGYDNLDAND